MLMGFAELAASGRTALVDSGMGAMLQMNADTSLLLFKIRTKISPHSKFTATAKNTGPVRNVLGVFGASVLRCWWLRELRELKMWVILICRTFVGNGKEQNGLSVSSGRLRRHLTLWTMHFHPH